MLIYSLVVYLYGIVIKLAALRKTKAKQWVNGRRNWREISKQKLAPFAGKELSWVHCASYGEFEQGRPLIESLKKKYPERIILLTFFSPSGYEAFQKWEGAEVILYLPLDSAKTARDFLQIAKPSDAIFIKYEFWLHYLKELQKNNVRTYLVSAVFKPHHPFFKWYGKIFRDSLKAFDKLFIQDEGSANLLKSIGINNYEICGDTRFDRVLQIKNSFTGFPEIQNFKNNHRVIIAGSTWSGDEDLILSAFALMDKKKYKLILAPHEVDEVSAAETKDRIEKAGFSYSFYTKGIDEQNSILVLDTIGMLSKIYLYADCAYIGGGFNGGLHNTLEPAVFGAPVIFYGDDKDRYNEVTELKKLGYARAVQNDEELARAVENYCESSTALQLRESIRQFVEDRARSTELILKSI
jgi:3-deoxy-D-manno-octulosonic-acid transferase